MKFLGREKEILGLEKEYARDGGFVVIYGRRRIGKTTLIKQFIKSKTAFYFLATKEVESQSMKRFAGVIARTTGNSVMQKAAFSDWLDLFQAVADYKPNEKKVLVIDEFPYLVKVNDSFPSILQNAWDEILKDSNVMLILCGSLISMMKKHALSYESPLYGRRTAQMRIAPLPFTTVYENQKLSFEEAAEQYSITGGVPKYMEFFSDTQPLYDQIKENILSKNGFLYEEPNFLLTDEVQVPTNYFSIIKVIADGNHKLGTIAGILGLETSALTPYLKTLSELGFIEKQVPVTEKNAEKTRKGLYFISDNFLRFWFRYVYPYKGELELDNIQISLDELNKDFRQKFVAFAYEDICKEIFAKLCSDKRIDFTPSKIGSYWLNDHGGNTQIDVMAIDTVNKRLFAGECKYHSQPVDADVYFELIQKVENSSEIQSVFKDYTVIFGLFSKSGFTNRILDISNSNSNLFLINETNII